MRSTLFAFLVAGGLLSFSAMAGSCNSPSAPNSFPDAATANQTDMLAAQQSVKDYLNQMEAVLKCTEASHDDRVHDIALDEMQKVAAKFNAVLKAFRAKQAS
jgi:hypothetical protein